MKNRRFAAERQVGRGSPLLGGISVDAFISRHWQRRPLLIRQAMASPTPWLDLDVVMTLAAEDTVESRLIRRRGEHYCLEHGPFDRADIPSLRTRNWTLLVQGVDLHLDQARSLLNQFRFIPDARLDDLMISLASDGGGVGPHVDAYDVFLLQVWGKRLWRYGPVVDPTEVADAPVRLLAHWEPTDAHLLEPGDMLYLPPGWGHDGVAQGPCMTCSIGFRTPSRHEFLAAMLAEAAEAPGGPDPRYGDAQRSIARDHSLIGQPTAQIPPAMYETMSRWAHSWRPEPGFLDAFIGRFLTEPKANVWFERPSDESAQTVVARLLRDGAMLDRRTRMLWRKQRVYINGEAIVAPRGTRALLRRLAEDRRLGARSLGARTPDDPLLALLLEWYRAGWVACDTTWQAVP